MLIKSFLKFFFNFFLQDKIKLLMTFIHQILSETNI